MRGCHKLFRFELLLGLSGLLILLLHVYHVQPSLDNLIPATVYRFKLDMEFEKHEEQLRVSVYLPVSDERQTVLSETLNSGDMLFSQHETSGGMVGRWSGDNLLGAQTISYSAEMTMAAIRYQISPQLQIPEAYSSELNDYLLSTKAIQADHPEIIALWQEIKPENSSLLTVLQEIFNYANELEAVEFKGYTDALTALRLGQASCNGKSRLFVALARQNGLPARLVGGVILKPGTKKTSHQWVEVNIQGRWVPFDPTNHYFAEIPHHYLTLYRGDKVLFKHTRNINFDYRFKIGKSLQVKRNDTDSVEIEVSEAILSKLFRQLQIDYSVSELLILFPLAALLVSICRNIVGLGSFGVFLPMLIAAGCRFTGLMAGLAGVVAIIAIAGALRFGMNRLKMLQIPRLAAMITIVTCLIFVISAFLSGFMEIQVASIALFPVVILSFMAERLVTVSEQKGPVELMKLMAGTCVIVITCYMVFSSVVLQGAFLHFPELLLLVLAAQVGIGRWSGFRVSEYLRFRKLLAKENRQLGEGEAGGRVLGLNARNLDLINPLNTTDDMLVANDKVRTKSILAHHAVPIPRTLAVVEDFWDIRSVEKQLPHWDSFVIKPAQGSQGNGIVVVTGRDNDEFILAGGQRWQIDQLIHHIREIIAGVYCSFGDRDAALIESLLVPSGFYSRMYAFALCDLRIVMINGVVSAAMLRIPTRESEGKANLHQGAIGVSVDIESGRTLQCVKSGKSLTTHPDSGVELVDLVLEEWSSILEVACQAQRAIPLGYIGVDVCVDRVLGPLVLEVNARPGLEIQNVHGDGFRDRYQRLSG